MTKDYSGEVRRCVTVSKIEAACKSRALSALLILILLATVSAPQAGNTQTIILDEFVYLPFVARTGTTGNGDLVAGIPGGIPGRTEICATADADTYGDDATDATAYIQSLIDDCPPGQVVYLPAGTYRLSDSIFLRGGITLRGAARPGVTRIRAATDTRSFVMASYNDWLYNV